MNQICDLELDMVIPSPLERISLECASSRDITLWMKRDDLIDPEISGNKWRKLKYNLDYAIKNELSPIVSFGGAFSNHIYALSAAAEKISLPSIGIIRGMHAQLDNPTLKFASSKSMKLIKTDQAQYRLKENSKLVQELLKEYPKALCIPEGGSNALATKGTAEIATEIEHQLGRPSDHIILSAGTGATAAGIIKGASPSAKIWVINALKNEGVSDDIANLLDGPNQNYTVLNQYHRGGFAKTDPSLIKYINDFRRHYNVPLEPIYTGKMMMALEDLIISGKIEHGSSVVVIHTGGLQGIYGHNERYQNRAEMQIHLD